MHLESGHNFVPRNAQEHNRHKVGIRAVNERAAALLVNLAGQSEVRPTKTNLHSN
jgi:hypothetical protein